MKISELIKEINALGPDGDYEPTCDKYKVGSGDQEITGVVVTMFATPDVIRQAKEKGANFIIVHEPMFYNHMDDHIPYKIGVLKKKLAEENGVTIYRYHDHAHKAIPDMICAGELKYLGFDNCCGTFESGPYYAVNRYHLNTSMTALELAKHIEKHLGIQHVRIIGCTDQPGKNISCCFGTPGHIIDELDRNDFVLTGEICEWAEGEAARDYAQLGYAKALLVLGHIGSERAGMIHLKDILVESYPDIKTQYIECGEVYSYTDSH